MRTQAVILSAVALMFSLAASANAQVTQVDLDVDEPILINEWILSGSVGGALDSGTADDESWAYEATVGYLRNGIAGLEFLANFAPDFEAENRFLTRPTVNSYMFNGIVGAPLGDEGSWKPYFSAGLGVMTLDSQLFDESPGDVAAEDFFETDDNQFAVNIGAGIMGFADHVGFRADVRYFADAEGDNVDPDKPELIGLHDVNFWRANVGLALRW